MSTTLPEPFDTIASIVERVDKHVRMLGGQGIDFVTAALVRSLVLHLVEHDERLTAAHVEPICQAIGIGLPTTVQRSMVPPPVRSIDHTETDR